MAKTTFKGPLATSSKEVIASGVGGAIDPGAATSILNADIGGDAFTLEDGRPNQYKEIVLASTAGGTAVITPTNLLGYTTITLAAPGESVTLKFVSDDSITDSWVVLGSQAAVIA